MDTATREQYEQRITELATFCFRKLANLEARFIALCARAEAAGIDCRDLREVDVRPAKSGKDEPDAALRLLN
ncbi:MAG: hypothetical protein ACT4O1_06505 [Gemmatimonadota bacterium]